MTIRTANSGDAVAITEIWNAIIRDTAITFTSDEKSREAIETLIRTRDVFVAEQNKDVVGFAMFGQFRPGPGYARVAEHTIYLSPSAQGKGFGRALMARLEDTARSKGISALVAGIGSEAQASKAFHLRMGFEKVGHLPKVGWKFGRAHDLIFMHKTLQKDRTDTP